MSFHDNRLSSSFSSLLRDSTIDLRFGVPSSIHSDQGRQYESQLFSEMCKVLHIKKTRTPYHPQSDGMVERFNKTLVRMLKSYINDHQYDWDEQLPFLTMAYRSVEH